MRRLPPFLYGSLVNVSPTSNGFGRFSFLNSPLVTSMRTPLRSGALGGMCSLSFFARRKYVFTGPHAATSGVCVQNPPTQASVVHRLPSLQSDGGHASYAPATEAV